MIDVVGVVNRSGLTASGVRDAWRRGQLPGRKIAGRLYFDEGHVEEWVVERTNPST